MKNNRKNIWIKRYAIMWIWSLSWLQGFSVPAQPTPTPLPTPMATIILTPHQTVVSAYMFGKDLSPETIEDFNKQARMLVPTAEFLANASLLYNCHSYAWHVSEGGSPVWIDRVSRDGTPQLEKYWTDGSYFPVTPTPTVQKPATKAYYEVGDHSAITLPQPGWMVSKWGKWPIMKHKWDDCPYDLSNMNYFRNLDNLPQPFAASYGGTGTDSATALALAHDGGYIVAGNTTSFGANNRGVEGGE